MKRDVLLNRKKTILLTVFALLLSPLNPAYALTYTVSNLIGNAQHAPSVWGQTFLVPVGYSGTISSVTNLTYTGYYNTIPSVIWAKVWDSPSKNTLLATSTNTYTGPLNSSGFTSSVTFSLNFPTFTVYGGNSYFLEVGRSSGDGYFFMHEDSGNSYPNGSVYRDGAIDTTYDLKFSFDITYPLAPTVAPAPSLTSSNNLKKGLTTSLSATTSLAGRISFKANGKSIPGCLKIAAIGSPLTATCTWKPALRGSYLVTAQLLPSDTATYSNSPLAQVNVSVSSRTNRR